jgi:hypothetical protein
VICFSSVFVSAQDKANLWQIQCTEATFGTSLFNFVVNPSFFPTITEAPSVQMIAFIQYFDEGVKTKFLFASNALEDSDSANSEALYKVIKRELKSMGIMRKFYGLQ